MKNIICLVIFLISAISYGQTVEGIKFDEEKLLLNVKTLSSDVYQGRRTGTEGAQMAESYIIDALRNLSVSPLEGSFRQPFTFTARQKEYNAVNILGFIKGSALPDDYIVISAHYDHEGVKNGQIYNGADDDASGVSALFAFAEYFNQNPPKHSVILAFFDAEELGLQGSRYYVENSIVPYENIKLNINMDMISRSDKNELYITGAGKNKAFTEIIISQESSKDFMFKMGHDGSDGLQNWSYSSDHGSFLRKGTSFLYFGVEDHKDYHQPTDDYESIHPEFYINAVKNIISVFVGIDNLEF